MGLRQNLYKTKIKRDLRKLLCRLMKPLATVIVKTEDKKRKADEEKTMRIVNEISQQDAIERLLDVMLREFAKYPDTEWSISIAEHNNSDDCIETIKEYMTDQRYDKYLRSWAYRLPFSSFEMNKSLTDKFVDRVQKHGAFKIETVNNRVYYQKYEGTFVITLTDEYLSAFKR